MHANIKSIYIYIYEREIEKIEEKEMRYLQRKWSRLRLRHLEILIVKEGEVSES